MYNFDFLGMSFEKKTVHRYVTPVVSTMVFPSRISTLLMNSPELRKVPGADVSSVMPSSCWLMTLNSLSPV